MAALMFLLILCCLKLNSVNCQLANNLGLEELAAGRLISADCNKQWFASSTIRKRCLFPSYSAAASKASNQRASAGSILQKNVDSQYRACSVRTLSCDANYKYRSFDGSCNHLDNPTWGMANTTYLRVLPASYRDGTYLPPVSTNGQPLPSARMLSSAFFPDADNSDRKVSLAGMQWGQFVAHDVALTANINSSEQIQCCAGTRAGDERTCLPIQIPSDDPFYARFNIACQDMVRSAFILSPDCTGIAEQFNHVSHLLDGSQIYGSDPNVAKTLREFKSGRLLTRTCRDGRTFLPTQDSDISCEAPDEEIRFIAGDTRVNQNPQLTILHTLFAREHNRIVEKLQQIHPQWNDEILFQEGRAIVIAEFQHITYNEWLPLILGRSAMNRYGLYSHKHRNFTFRNNLAPVTINSFASSAFRVGHSAIQGQISMFSSYSECPVRSLNFSNLFNTPAVILQQQHFDEFTRGLTKQSMQQIDNFHTSQITQQLFHGNSSHGADLLSFDIQRGRDHGIPSYIELLNLCTGYKPQTFEDLRKFIKAKFISQLQQHYTNINDIDLFIGGVLENPNEGSRIGPTFQCIIAEQFYRYKYGDRFWYEIRGQRHSLTNGQLHEIKKATLSRIICDNTNSIANIAPRSFLQLSDRNDAVPCENLPSINISRW